MDLDLDAREGLPDALRVLLAEHPRAGWQADPSFGGLVAFWLDRHLGFRRLTGLMRQEAELLLDRRADPAAFGPRLSRLGSHFLRDIHGHHTIEDAHFFPLLSAKEGRLAAGFDMLEQDHHALDAHLGAFAEGANGALRSLDRPAELRTAAGRFLETLGRLDRFLDRHLVDEEDLVVPVILRHGEGFLGH
jgi:iron-sulfur cluster repair protein YtfE (RIC family)